jgi:hypothetical protein
MKTNDLTHYTLLDGAQHAAPLQAQHERGLVAPHWSAR